MSFRRRNGALPALLALACASPAALAAPDAAHFTTTAPIAYMVDLGSGRTLFARDADRRFPPASLTKIMTAQVVFGMIAADELRPQQTMIVSEQAARRWAGVGTSMNLKAGSRVSVDALLTGLMTASVNDGAIVLAEGAAGSVERFAARMNAEASRLGLGDSRFGTPNGWPDGGRTMTSARDLATLTQAMIEQHPALYRRYVGRVGMDWNGVRLANRLPLLGVPGADGVKTGYTRESGYGVVGSAERDGRRLVLVLGGMDSEPARRQQARAFLDWGFDAWEARRLFTEGQRVTDAEVQQGATRRVGLVAPRPYFATLRRGEPASYRLTVRYSGPLEAPLRQGQHVADLVVSGAGEGERRLPLLAARDVAEANAWQRLRNGLFGWLGL